jgi:hypothetical protein
MNIKSLFQTIRKDRLQGGLSNLFQPTIKHGVGGEQFAEVQFRSYTVNESDEMRIDLILQNIYELDNIDMTDFYQHIDVLLALNNIDNPLNIRRGTILLYPTQIGQMELFRIEDEVDKVKSSRRGVINRLGVPNKQTRKDKSRSDYLKNGLALPPTALEQPKTSVDIKNGKFIIGGL